MACSTKIGTNLAQSEEMALKPPHSICFFIFYKLRQIRIFSRTFLGLSRKPCKRVPPDSQTVKKPCGQHV